MMRRFRPRLALIALLALTASTVEQASAAVACVEMGEPVASSAVAAGSVAHDHAAAGHASAPSAAQEPGSSDHEGSPADPGSCPMSAAAGMACGIAALPALTAGPSLGAQVHRLAAPAAETQPGSLALSTLFRPPRR